MQHSSDINSQETDHVLGALMMPEDQAGRAAFLDKEAVSGHMPEFCAGLAARDGYDPETSIKSPDQALGPYKADFLEKGFSALPEKVLHTLLQNPIALLAVSMLALQDGGQYWTDLMDRHGPTRTAEDSRIAFEKILKKIDQK